MINPKCPICLGLGWVSKITRTARGIEISAASAAPACRASVNAPMALNTRTPAKSLRASREVVRPATPEFDRDEVVVCILIAFCLGNAALSVIYRLMT
jgi:hypothetical protein